MGMPRPEKSRSQGGRAPAGWHTLACSARAATVTARARSRSRSDPGRPGRAAPGRAPEAVRVASRAVPLLSLGPPFLPDRRVLSTYLSSRQSCVSAGNVTVNVVLQQPNLSS